MKRRNFLSSLLALIPLPFLKWKKPGVDRAIDSMASVLCTPRLDATIGTEKISEGIIEFDFGPFQDLPDYPRQPLFIPEEPHLVDDDGRGCWLVIDNGIPYKWTKGGSHAM
jgi:hypothetical protein